MLLYISSTVLFILLYPVYGLNNGLALTPPMGWLAWERFRCNINCAQNPKSCISENLFMEMADHLIKDGYKDAGYVHVNIDDCWMSPYRASDGSLIADSIRFPSGIKFLADYMHARGLKLGIYQDFGTHTCMGYPGIVGHMELDAKTFAEWDVDMVKLDGCHSLAKDMDRGYIQMGNYLNKTGRHMVYSCSWPYYQLIEGMEPNYTRIAKHCNLWRNFHDIKDSWDSIMMVINFYGDNQEVLVPRSGPGHWNDPDMLLIGNYGLNYEQAKVQMAMWAIFAAPLLMSNDLRSIEPKFKQILLNSRVIAVNQDPLGIQGKRVFKKDGVEIWTRPITPVVNGFHSYAIAFLNCRKDSASVHMSISLQELGLKNPTGYHLSEVFNGHDFGIVSFLYKLNTTVKSNAVMMFRVNSKN